MTRLDQYDTAIDLLVQASKIIEAHADDEPDMPLVRTVIRDRLRILIAGQIKVTELLIHEFADIEGVFADHERLGQ
jgi:hypothetical protein